MQLIVDSAYIFSTVFCVCVCATASHYAAILFPHSPGAVRDLARSAELGNIVAHFVEENSKLPKYGTLCLNRSEAKTHIHLNTA